MNRIRWFRLLCLLIVAGLAFGACSPEPPTMTTGQGLSSISAKVLVIIYDPTLPDGTSLRSHYSFWQDPQSIVADVQNDIHTDSHGVATFTLPPGNTIIVRDRLPAFDDGFRYTASQVKQIYDTPANQRKPLCHQQNCGLNFSYFKVLDENHAWDFINQGKADEVWIVGPPFPSGYESQMAGPNAYWINGPVVANAPVSRRFAIHWFNYERLSVNALHSFGHRAEGVLNHIYGTPPAEGGTVTGTFWDYFTSRTQVEKQHPGGFGTVHIPVNGVVGQDYSYSLPGKVASTANSWLVTPLPPPSKFTTTVIGCEAWNCQHPGPGLAEDDEDRYLNWWFTHMPWGQQNAPNWWVAIVGLKDTVDGGGGGGGQCGCYQGDGDYCGAGATVYAAFHHCSVPNLNPGDIYTCRGGTWSLKQTCASGCSVAPAGQADTCQCGCYAGDGQYCGANVLEYASQHGCSVPIANGSDLDSCSGGNWTITETCANGCSYNPNGADACTPPPSCNGTVCGGNCCPAGDWCGTGGKCCSACGSGCPC